MHVPAIRLAASAAMALFVVAAAPLTAAAQDDNPVIATVNSEEIRRDEVLDAIRRMPQQIQQMPPEILIPAIAEQLATSRLMSARGYSENLQDSDAVKQRVAEAERSIVQDVWLEQAIDARMSDASVTAAYEEFLAANPPVEEISARHILVETEEEAIALIGRLDGGEEFAALATEASIGPSGPRGGDLGYFMKEQMVAPFAEAAFAMEPGEYSAAPVETQFGWHVILVEDRRLTASPTLDEMRDQLETGLADQYVQEIVAELREGADIVVFGPNGEVPEN